MKQFILVLLAAVCVTSCKKEPKNYVTFSGKISNKNSDSLVVSNRDYSKTITVNNDGTFTDTLHVSPNMYAIYDGNEQTMVYLKNGYELKLTLNTEEFDESITYSGTGAENNNFIAKKALMEEKLLDLDALSQLNEEELEPKLTAISSELKEFYNSNPNIDTTIVNTANKNLEPMLNSYKKFLKQGIQLRKDLPEGSNSPTFANYENIDGTKTSLSDLKGKYVYIDVWATWCGPCKAEIPALKELEQTYHDKNIQFVSISIDDDRAHGNSWDKAKQSWKAMVADKNLGGIQLFAPKGWESEFITNYKIKGIPRFILIDPNGKIISPDAPRPSSTAIKAKLEAIL